MQFNWMFELSLCLKNYRFWSVEQGQSSGGHSDRPSLLCLLLASIPEKVTVCLFVGRSAYLTVFCLSDCSLKGGRAVSDVFPSVWNLRAVSSIPLFYISSFVLMPSRVALSTFDFFFQKPPFSERQTALCGFFFFFLSG